MAVLCCPVYFHVLYVFTLCDSGEWVLALAVPFSWVMDMFVGYLGTFSHEIGDMNMLSTNRKLGKKILRVGVVKKSSLSCFSQQGATTCHSFSINSNLHFMMYISIK